jgi:hypothetical protein
VRFGQQGAATLHLVDGEQLGAQWRVGGGVGRRPRGAGADARPACTGTQPGEGPQRQADRLRVSRAGVIF